MEQMQEENDLLFTHRVSVELTPENATFFPSAGHLISLTLRGESGEETFERVVPVRAFPITDPEEFICIKEPDSKEKGRGAEIGMIISLRVFDEGTQALLRGELERRYFAPEIHRILNVKEKFGYSYWDAETSAGKINFVMTNVSSNIRMMEDGRVFIYDIDGNCFQIPNTSKLDRASFKRIEIYM